MKYVLEYNEMKRILIVIPAFNEERIIKEVIQEIKKSGYSNIIIVDDGSFDDTAEISHNESVLVLRHIINRGKGAAIKTGIEAAKILNAPAVVTIDADGQHDPKDIKKMVKKIEEGYDIILGTRMSNAKAMPIPKIIANYLGNIFTWLFYGIWVSDSQCGFRAYSKKALSLIDTQGDRYEYDSEVIKEISRHKLKFVEVPIDIRYTQYSMHKKQKQSLWNGVKTLTKMILTS